MAFIKVNIVKHIREAGKIFDNGKYVRGEEIIINLNEIIKIQDNPSSIEDGFKSLFITMTNGKYFYITGDYATILNDLNKTE